MTEINADERAARRAFADWAALQPHAPRDAESLIENVAASEEHAGILTTNIEGRRVVWKSIPASSRARVTPEPVAIESVDPWTANATTLRTSSDHIALCDACGGERKVACKKCHGTGRQHCANCGGEGKRYGVTANGSRRMLNCANCRGRGFLDCGGCRRGIANCAACGGEGRVQRWIELETWQHPVTSAHPESLATTFAWNANVDNDALERDAGIIFDIDQLHSLTAADVGSASSRWLELLQEPLQPGERVMRQRLRITTVPMHAVRYRLGSEEDAIVFAGRRLIATPAGSTAFSRRASRLRLLALLLAVVLIIIAILSLGRGLFYASLPTFLSLAAATGMVLAVWYAVSEWTGRRRHTRTWWITAAVFLALATGGAIAALPRASHAQQLLATGNLDAAQRELAALGEDAPAAMLADFHLARIRGTTDFAIARKQLARIPRELPQYAAGASLIYLPPIKRAIESADFSAAANAIVAARNANVVATELDPFIVAMRSAADNAIAVAKRERNAKLRLDQRKVAEAMLIAWEKAAARSETQALSELRAAIARDVAALEKPARRRRK